MAEVNAGGRPNFPGSIADEQSISIWSAPPFPVFERWDPSRSHGFAGETTRQLWNPALAAKNAASMGHPLESDEANRTGPVYRS